MTTTVGRQRSLQAIGESYESLREKFTNAGQGHVFAFWDELNEDEREVLLSHLRRIDVDRVNRIYHKSTTSPPKPQVASIAPLPQARLASTINNANKVSAWEERGLRLIAHNKVGVILLAGGQGTRLGSSAPKGCYDIGLPSHKSLFRLQAERIRRLESLATKYATGTERIVIPWYIMVSGPTKQPTVSYFRDNNFFGLDPENVFFFEQGVLPAFTNEGKIFMETKNSPSLAPDGNGGIYSALQREGVIKDLERRRIQYVHTYCVDNCLVKVADPVFIGYCVEQEAECGAKAVPKASPEESVGVICLRDGKFSVVEYSEIDKTMAAERKPDGNLVYNAANIANHFYTVDFLRRVDELEGELEYHIAHKKIKHVDLTTGEPVAPTSNNGIKLEMFIFDVFPFIDKMAVLEVDRKDEFSPLKNAPGSGSDSPETSRADILNQCVRWARAAGANVIKPERQTDDVIVLEISPLVSYAGEGLTSLKGVSVNTPKYLEDAQDLKDLIEPQDYSL
ncbi:UDP-N-acetylglucosamine pyrophosphorylase [Gaertneriomyces sp. JEL0708]|nr:UDP-N-acetylglucosamine pyrophosphorylase [Gaertneriomyces sp. JEL0708]